MKNEASLLKKIKTCYMLTIVLISLFGCTVKLYGAQAQRPFWGASARQGERETMEDLDSVEYRNGLHCFAVYDGHGGWKAAEFVKKHLCENFFKAEGRTISDKLENAFLKTDTDFLTHPGSKDDKSGTTAVVAVVNTHINKVSIAHAGDSRAIVMNNGKIFFATKDHKPASEVERIKEAGGRVLCGNIRKGVSSSLAVSRAIGDRDYKEWVIPDPDVSEVSFNEGDVLVLACDGLWDVMTNKEVASFVHKKCNRLSQENLAAHDSVQNTGKEIVCEDGDEGIKLVARALRDEAYDRGSGDNISVLIVVKPCPLSWTTRLLRSMSINKNIILGFVGVGGVVALFYYLRWLGYCNFP